MFPDPSPRWWHIVLWQSFYVSKAHSAAFTELNCLPHPHSLTLGRSLARLLSHSVTHSLTHSPTHPLTQPPTHQPTHPPTHSLTNSLTHSLTHPPTHSLTTHSLTHSFTQLSDWFTDYTHTWIVRLPYFLWTLQPRRFPLSTDMCLRSHNQVLVLGAPAVHVLL